MINPDVGDRGLREYPDLTAAPPRQATAVHLEVGSGTSQVPLELIVNTSPSMLAYWDHQLLNRFANRAYEQWFGVRAVDLNGRHIRTLLGEALYQKNLPYIERALMGEAQTFEREIDTPHGKRQALARYQPDVRDGVVQGFLAEVTDVTQLKHAEAKLQAEMLERHTALRLVAQSAERLAEAQRIGGVGSWHLDLATMVSTYSEEMCRIFGRDPDEGGPSWEDRRHIYTPHSYQILEAWLESARTAPACLRSDLQFVRPDGTTGWIDVRGEPVLQDGKVVALQGTALDITGRHQLQQAIRDQHELLKVTLNSIGDAVITTDAQARITWLNPVAERLTGWLTADATGRALSQVFRIINEDTRQPAPDPVQACLQERRVFGLPSNTMLISRTGVEISIEDTAAPILGDSGDLLGGVLVFHDVTEKRRLSREMTHRALHDALTGLYNRAEFEERLRRAYERSITDASQNAILYVDLDQFKLVNDSCGHSVGDRLLQQVAGQLAACAREHDTVARVGGDEFSILLEHCPLAASERIARLICDRLGEFRFHHDGKRFRVGASVGLVPVDRRWKDLTSILQAVDMCCYAAKEAGRNRVHVWSETDEFRESRSGEMRWATRLEEALDEDRFLLFAQRIQRPDGRDDMLQAEVLLRMQEPDGQIVLPGLFMPAAERFHLIGNIDRLVLQKTVDVLARLPDGEQTVHLQVNLSGQSVGDRAFHRWAVDLLRTIGPDQCRKLCLEITETSAVTNLIEARSFVDAVRQLGCKVALDDFGAGSSSFGYLRELQVDRIKIDGQFIRNLGADRLNRAAVQCFIETASIVKADSVAEGVEDPEALHQLRQMGVNWVQGFHVHRPEPIETLLHSQALTLRARARA